MAVTKNLCLGMVQPYNAHATNHDYVGQLIYEEEDWIRPEQVFGSIQKP